VAKNDQGKTEAENIEAKDDQGRTALHVAAHRGRIEEVKLLLDKGANIEARDNDGNTPLICAAEAGGIIRFGKQGADIEKYPAADVINLLLDRGAKIEAKSNWGQTALHRAAFRGRPDVVKVLLDRGANIQAMDNHGDTALYLANVTRRDWQAAVKEDAGNPSPGARQVEGNTLSDREEVDLQNHPRDRARRDNVVKLAAALPTPPPIPEQARRLFERASALMKQASEPQELDQSINLLRWALVFAPWWGDAYHNLSRALELTGQYDLAEKNLTYYLELKPPEADARAARAHFSEIQTEKETAASKK
jgi:tetratricopeptide (TPR) repeat protein